MRRRRSKTEAPSRAADTRRPGDELPADRIDRIEALLRDLHAAVDVSNKRILAIQAQVDHLEARVGRR